MGTLVNIREWIFNTNYANCHITNHLFLFHRFHLKQFLDSNYAINIVQVHKKREVFAI